MFADWYEYQSDAVQSAVDVSLEFLAQRTRNEWRRPEFDLLSGKMRAIGEIRFKVDKQYRILGFFGPNRHEFTMLLGASKKGNVYTPTNALDSALERHSNILKDGRRCCVWDY
jgi:hypothetical protein